MSIPPPETNPAAELEAIETIQDRIDRVAEDLVSSEPRYSKIDAWKLGELLGLDLDDTADWGRNFLAYRRNPEDDCDYPYAENIQLLQGKIPASRYRKLASKAKAVEQGTSTKDLPLTKKEAQTLKDAYAEQNAGGSALILAGTFLYASDGEELEFEVVIGDGGEPGEGSSPYDLMNGNGFDASNYVDIE